MLKTIVLVLAILIVINITRYTIKMSLIEKQSLIVAGYKKPTNKIGEWNGAVVAVYNMNYYNSFGVNGYPRFYCVIFDDGMDFLPNSILDQKDVYEMLINRINEHGYTEPMTKEDISHTCGVGDVDLITVSADYFNPDYGSL